MTDWPVWATETVEVRPPDPAWHESGQRERETLEVRLAPWLVASVEHVGSTAVPGLIAKPILDLQAAVTELDLAPLIAKALAPDGWHYVAPELDERPWRRFFVKVRDNRRVAHLHVMARGTARWEEQIAFRDALRVDAHLVDAYAALKSRLAAQHALDREKYSAAKSDFVRTVLEGEAATP